MAAGRRVPWLPLLGLLMAVSAGPVLAQGPADGFEPGLFEVRVGRGVAATLPTLVDHRGEVLLPLLRLLERTGLPVERDPGSPAVSIPTLGSSQPTTLDPRRPEIRCGTRVVALPSGSVLVREDEIYVTTSAVAEYLQAEVRVDWEMLRVDVVRAPPFPVEQRAEAAERRALLSDPAEPASRAGGEEVPLTPASGGLALDWGVSTPVVDPVRGAALRLQLGTALYGGELVAGTTVHGDRGGAASPPVHASYRRVFPDAPLVSQLELGDVVAVASLARSIRGISLSNAPLIHDVLFDEVPVAPSLPSGWEYEIYQDGQLLGYSTGAQTAPVMVPLRYGSTPLQVRMLSPSGEEIVSDMLYQVPTFQVAPGKLQYAAAAGTCPQETCALFAFGDLKYGAARWLTVHGGAELLRDSSGTVHRPYGSVFASGLNGWYTVLQASRSAYWRSQIGYSGYGSVSGVLGGGVESPTAAQPSILAGTGERWHADGMLTVRAQGLPWGAHSLRVEGRAEGRELPRRQDQAPSRSRWWTTGVGLDFRRVSAALHYERPLDRLRDQLRVSSTVVLPGSAPGALANRALSASVRGDAWGVNQVEAMTSLQVRRSQFLGMSLRWQQSGGVSLNLSYSAVLGWSRFSARGTSGRAGSGGTLQWTGGMYLQQPLEPVGLPEAAVSGAGVAGRVFLDRDGDGQFGHGDEPLAGVPITVGAKRALAGDGGQYQVWNVVPYELLQVTIDTLKIPNPSWTPARPSQWLRPVPHQLNRVDLPLVLTREVVGRLEDGAGSGIGGVTVHVRALDNGLAAETVTFSDGEFYLSRLRPGSYTLSIAASSLEALDAVAEPDSLSFRIQAGGDPMVELPPVVVRPRGGVAAPDSGTAPADAPVPVSADAAVSADDTPAETAREFMASVYFGHNQAVLSSAARAALDRLTEGSDAEGVRLHLVGHASPVGSPDHNLRLSAQRAQAVTQYLLRRGLTPQQITVEPAGDREPVSSGVADEVERLSRRVDVWRVSTPNPEPQPAPVR